MKKTLKMLINNTPVKIVAFGDSLTNGWMVHKGYINFLEEKLRKKYPKSPLKIINRGVPGNTAQDAMYRIKEDVLDENPHLTIIQFALNDAYVGHSPIQFRNNIIRLITTIQENISSEILLITSTYLNNPKEYFTVKQFYLQLEIVAREYNLPIIKVHEYWEEQIKNKKNDFYNLVQGDLVHPTENGYELMAEAIFKIF